MSDNKIKHLEFIQNVITRMNSNSFLIKGWTITIVSALYALCAKDANTNYVLVSYISIPVFWVLDGFYISQERQYRDLYKEVALKDDNQIDFGMDASKFNKGNRTWILGILSKTLVPFYGLFILLTLIIMFLIKR
ncbi:hypothetical protein OX283_009475 [Flavobacterium sp. SUN052]|uniref:hypothetical protein n=1 Tax=Flavobacterium sp. SUN052 TaxID=3002441 RepID=UPI00237D8CCA|nr:hypothetical protein [Flavobacterium sp. SUN052]MEC4004884.1 hypothetical protein [Flavobacterium sp. SUN052]